MNQVNYSGLKAEEKFLIQRSKGVFDRLDVVMTATVRPAIIDLTLKSFTHRFLGSIPRRRLIINIDPIGDVRRSAVDVIEVARRYFSDVVYRLPEQPSFPSAVQWGWQQVESDFFLHLEDDWLLTQQVDTRRLLGLFQADADLATIRLNLTRNPAIPPLRTDGLSLNPSIVRTAYIREALPFFSTNQDPEKQFSQPSDERKQKLTHWRHMLYGDPGERAYVVDIGKKWRRLHEFGKWERGSGDVVWQRHIRHRFGKKMYFWLKYRFFLWFWNIRA